MDVFSHGLWGSLVCGSSKRTHFWLAFTFGIAPDIASFGVLTVASWLGLSTAPDFSQGTPPESSIPLYVHRLYPITHSLIVFGVLFALIWIVRGQPLWEMMAWGLHILMDIPVHSFQFFPTPFLWPISDWKFDGWQWMTPEVLIPNGVLLLLGYGWFWYDRLHKSRA